MPLRRVSTMQAFVDRVLWGPRFIASLFMALARVMKNLLYGIGAGDPMTFAAVFLLLLAVVVAASYLPARRATQVNPAIALRYD